MPSIARQLGCIASIGRIGGMSGMSASIAQELLSLSVLLSSVLVRYGVSMSKTREIDHNASSVLVIGNNFWGHGADLAQAKKTFTNHGGRLSLGYTIVEFSDGLKFNGVDQMGGVHWTDEKWTEGETPRDPKMTEVKPRGKSK